MRLDPQVTNVYADALFSLAKKQGVVQPLSDNVRMMGSMLAVERARLRTFFFAPHISDEDKERLIEKVVRPYFLPLLTDFILYLLKKDRLDHLRPILERYQVLAKIDQGILPAHVKTAVEVPLPLRDRLRSALERFTGKRLEIQYRVEPKLIGGVVFTAQDLYIDDSLLGHLKRLREQLQAVEVH